MPLDLGLVVSARSEGMYWEEIRGDGDEDALVLFVEHV